MRTFRFEKIVRNKIPGRMEQSGSTIESRQLTKEEVFQLLLDKVIEEAREAKAAPLERRAGELADLRTTLREAENQSGLLQAEITRAAAEKTAADGDFDPPVYIVSMTVADDDPWVNYFEANPDRYPEIIHE